MNGTRREFLEIIVAVGAGGGLVLTACGGDDSSSDASAGCAPNINFSSNHGHTLSIPAAHVAEGATRTYDITGTADHTHEVVITAASFAMLDRGETVMVGSTAGDSGDGHNHDLALRCT
jgi:hypothetical protein